VINYLRKEKEIVDMQLELGKQENARLKTQIGHVTRDLEDTRTTLSDVSPHHSSRHPVVDLFCVL
jgi:nucleoprotein TPR